MAKTDLTQELEKEIWQATRKMGVFGCFEVTIGWFGNERVDYMTCDTKGIWRCYEIKVSKSDFNSKSKVTFVGHFNYYVLPQELYEQVKDEIPKHIGVYVNGRCARRAKRQELAVSEKILSNSLIRSLYREAEKLIRSGEPSTIERLTRMWKRAQAERDEYRRKYWELMRIGQKKYGTRWYKEVGHGTP